MMNRGVLLFGILILLSSFVQKEPNRRVKKYSSKDGLSQNVVNSIVKDKKGLLWFATEDGLNRFDGYTFKVFKSDHDNKYSLADNYIASIFKDSDGDLWVSSRKGLQYFDPEKEQFHLFRHEFPGRNFVDNDVSVISESHNKNLLIGWYGNGFGYFDKKQKKFSAYTTGSLQGLSSGRTLAILEDSYGLLWVGTEDGGVDVFQVNNGKIIKKIEELSDKKLLPSRNVRCLLEDHYGNIWIGTYSGLVVYKRQDNKFHVFNSRVNNIREKSIFSLSEDNDKNLWIGAHGSGLYKVDLRQLATMNIEELVLDQIQSLGDFNICKKTIQSIYEDKDKNLWVGTFGDGLYLISNSKEKFIKIHNQQQVNYTGNIISYYGIANDEKGDLWMGTDGDGIYKTKPDGEVLKHYFADGKKGSLTDNAILSAHRDKDNNLWFGTYSQGIFLYDKRSDSFINYRHDITDSANHGGNDVRVIFEDSKRNIWVGTNRGGLCLVNKISRTFKHFSKSSRVLTNGDIRAIHEDQNGNIWVGLYGDGLYCLNPKTGKFERFFYKSENNNLLKSNIVFALATDHKNRLWIGTASGGLSAYHLKKETFENYNEKDGLANNTVYAVVVDNTDKVWLSTNKGISMFDSDKKKFTNYNYFDGLQEGQFNSGAVVMNTAGGYIGFGGTMGFNIFYPYHPDERQSNPHVIISGLQVFNKPVAVNTSNRKEVILPKVVSESEEIVLKHDESVFTLEFVAPNFSFPEKTNYAYKLDGLDDDWNYVGQQRTATYRYLNPGDYVFKVKASNNENEWENDYTSIELKILPPWWKTTYAYLVYVLLFLTITLILYHFRKKQLRLRKRLMLVKAQRKKERQLVREKLSFFTEVSHEFRTPLTLMLGPLEEMLNNEGSLTPTGKKLKMVRRNAFKLLNLINKLLDYRKVETGNMMLKIREENIVTFVEEIYLTFRELAAKKNILFDFAPEASVILVWFDREKLETILNNLISNSFKYIGSGNKVVISLREDSGNAIIEINDNGIGISKKKQKHIFDWFYQGDQSFPMSSGIGLSLTKKLVELHNGAINVESEENGGATFRVEFPLGLDHFDKDKIHIAENTHSKVIMDIDPDSENIQALSEEKHSNKGLKKILLIEDDEEIRGFLKEYLEKKYLIYESPNGKAGMEIALEKHPDVIISDIMMPEMNGVDFCRVLKSNLKTSHIPVILLTAKASLTDQKEGAEIGADAYITKPFSPELLVLKIESLLISRENLKRFYRNLFNMNSPKKVDASSPDEKLLGNIYQHLKVNLDKPDFNVAELCDAMNMSRSLLYKKVKMLTGASPVEYIRSIRLQEAAELLKTEKYKIYEVMYLVGFNDQKYFRQSFTKEFGCSPSEYIKANHAH